MPMLADRVKETTITEGTGTLALGGAVVGFQGFVAGAGTGTVVYYCIENGLDWEVGQGTVTDGAPDTLSRTTVLASSNANALVDWGAGSKTVFLDIPAALVLSLIAGLTTPTLAQVMAAGASVGTGAQEITFDDTGGKITFSDGDNNFFTLDSTGASEDLVKFFDDLVQVRHGGDGDALLVDCQIQRYDRGVGVSGSSLFLRGGNGDDGGRLAATLLLGGGDIDDGDGGALLSGGPAGASQVSIARDGKIVVTSSDDDIDLTAANAIHLLANGGDINLTTTTAAVELAAATKIDFVAPGLFFRSEAVTLPLMDVRAEAASDGEGPPRFLVQSEGLPLLDLQATVLARLGNGSLPILTIEAQDEINLDCGGGEILFNGGPLAFAFGGTGLAALGIPLQVLRTNAGATAMEWADPSGGSTDAQTLDGIDSTGFALAGHTHAAGDAATLDGIDSTGFSLAAHTHTLAAVLAAGADGNAVSITNLGDLTLAATKGIYSLTELILSGATGGVVLPYYGAGKGLLFGLADATGIRLRMTGTTLLVRTGDDTTGSKLNADILSANTSISAPAFIFGLPDATGVRLDLEAGPVLAVRNGGDSVYGSLLAGNLRATTSVGVGAADTTGALLKLETGRLALREGDDSAYNSMNLGALLASSWVAIGAETTAGIRLRLSGGTLAVREGDDSAAASLSALDLTLTTPLAAINGGTGTATYAQGDTLYASATNVVSKLAKGTALQYYRMNAGATVPEWATLAVSTLAQVLAAGADGNAVALTNIGAIGAASLALTAALPTTSGGTGLAAYTAGDILYSSATNVLSKLAKGTTLQRLRMNVGATAPEWAAETVEVSAWQTETFTGSWSTNTTYTGKSRLVGNRREFWVQVSLSGIPTTAALTITLPWTVDETLLGGGAQCEVATGHGNDNGTVWTVQGFYVLATNVMRVMRGSASSAAVDVTQAIPFNANTGDYYELRGSVPV